MKRFSSLLLLSMAPLAGGCTEEVGNSGAGGGAGAGGAGGGDPFAGGTPLSVDVPASGRVYVDLDEPAVLDLDDAAAASSDAWELAFEGYEIFTSSGPSGPGVGGAFGPLSPETFLSDTRPDVPFILADKAGGVFLDWYDYDGVSHTIWSRYHVYGVHDELDRYFKVQVLSYYGEIEGAPVRAIYQLRWAEVTSAGSGATTFVDDLDATAGGTNQLPDQPSACLDLASGDRLMLTPKQALASSAWHLCFRRDNVSVNGDAGGPRGVTAVDPEADATETETLEEVEARTADSELPDFDAADYAALSDPALPYQGDGIVTAFGADWYDAEKSPIEPALASWLVLGPDGETTFLLAFIELEDPTDDTPGRVNLRVKRVE